MTQEEFGKATSLRNNIGRLYCTRAEIEKALGCTDDGFTTTEAFKEPESEVVIVNKLPLTEKQKKNLYRSYARSCEKALRKYLTIINDEIEQAEREFAAL